jgi:tRNA(fMet)-specific endonuclease VapC
VNYLLDTDTCVFALRHDSGVLRRLKALSPDEVAVTSMTEAELWYGAWQSRDPASSRHSVAAFLEPIVRLPFDSESAERHAELRFSLRAHPIGERELVIASVAVTHGITLVTHNRREFTRVTDLALEDWTTPS